MWTEREPEPSLEPAATVEAYAASPAGKYFCGPCFVAWTPTPALTGVTLWGEPSREDCLVLVQAWQGLQAGDALIDMGRVGRLSPDAADVVRQLLAEAHPEGRRALIRSEGLDLGPLEAWCSFADPQLAYDWLDASGSREQIDRLVSDTMATPRLIRELRALLASRLEDGIALPDCAVILSTSERTLQRHLQEFGTSFRREVDLVRLAAAHRVLGASNHKLEVVSRMVGMSSVSQLSLLFRRATGITPGAYRRRLRG